MLRLPENWTADDEDAFVKDIVGMLTDGKFSVDLPTSSGQTVNKPTSVEVTLPCSNDLLRINEICLWQSPFEKDDVLIQRIAGVKSPILLVITYDDLIHSGIESVDVGGSRTVYTRLGVLSAGSMKKEEDIAKVESTGKYLVLVDMNTRSTPIPFRLNYGDVIQASEDDFVSNQTTCSFALNIGTPDNDDIINLTSTRTFPESFGFDKFEVEF